MLQRTVPLLLVLASTAVCQNTPPGPALITSDVMNFWRAYDASKPGNREDAFRRLYYEPGTMALRDYLSRQVGSPQSLEAAVDQRFPQYYKTARPYMLEVENQRGTILQYLARFRELYPEADFPPVTFVVGSLSTKELISPKGVVIDVAAFSRGPGADVAEIRSRPFEFAIPPDRLPLIVVHELVHTQSVGNEGDPLPSPLIDVMREGAADFMTELVTRIDPNAHTARWAEPRRAQMFQDLVRYLHLNDEIEESGDPWHPAGFASFGSPLRLIYSQPSSGDEPATLGNWIGKQICASYYARSGDKSAAVRELVSLKNIAGVIRGSEYSWLLQPAK